MFPGDPWEDLEDDYSGCTWTSSVFEFPTWTASLEKTLSENLQDVFCLPKPLTPQKLVTSNTATVDYVNLDTSVPGEKSCNKVKIPSVDSPEKTCICCLCVTPANVLLPVLACNTLSKNNGETNGLPIVTSNSNTLVEGYFSGASIVCNNTIVDSAFKKVSGSIKDRYKIPRIDPQCDPSENFKKSTTLEVMSYLIGLFVDIIPKDLASLWSEIIGRSVTAPERFGLTSLTAQEMIRLRNQYSSEKGNNKVSEKNNIIEQDPPRVSTCMNSSLTSHYPLPHVAVVVNQSGHNNLKVERAMVDTGSQISLVSSDYLARHNHDKNAITPLSQPCSLKLATGRSINPTTTNSLKIKLA